MEAKVYIKEEFFTVFDTLIDQTAIGSIDKKTENKNQLINILNNSKIHSLVDNKYLLKLIKKNKSVYQPENIKDLILYRAFRNSKFKNIEENLNASNSIFLMDNTSEEANNISTEKNIISISKDYEFQYPISPKSFASKLVDKEMNGIDCVNHKCRNVILIDPYIFEDQHGFELKIPNLLKLLKELYIHNTRAVCFLSILTNKKDNDNKFKSKINQIEDGMDNVNLTVNVYAHDEALFKNNRHIITDYSIIDTQHLFDRDEASVSVNYLYDGDIHSNFTRVQKLKQKIIDNYMRDPEKMGIYTRKFGNILSNPLLQ